MNILLLGTTGLLGHNVLKQLLFDGHKVVALVRDPKKVLLRHNNLQIIKGPLDQPTIINAAQGCEAIINCVGVTDMALLHLTDYTAINSELPKILISAMKHHGISTLIHISTANTIGYGAPTKPSNEASAIEYPFSESFYAQSKLTGEAYLQQASQENPTGHIIIVNPGFMIGPYDVKPSSGTLLLTGYQKPIMAAPKGGKSFIAAKDAAVAITHALTMGTNGNRYLLTGSNMTLKEFYRLQADTMGYRQIFVSLPNWIVSIAGRIGDCIRYCGIKTQLSTRNVRQLMVTEHYDNTKAVDELHMPQTPIETAIRDFFDWWGNK